MREQTLPKFKSQTGLLPGMLKRTKYSRLRNDSLSSLEDRPQRMLPLKTDLCLDSDFAQLDPGTPTHHEPSTLRDFIPRVANIRLQSPISLQGLRGQTAGDRTTDRPLSRTEWCSAGPDQRFCSQLSLNVPLSTGHTALSCTKRPITLHRMASLSWTPNCPPCSQHRDSMCCLKTPCAANRAVHHHIKYMGSVEVIQSMRTLDFDTRMQVTREAISRLCGRASAKTAVKHKRPVCKRLPSAVLGQINLQFSGRRIILAVSTDSLTLITASSLQKIAHHPMHAISFASGGDPDMADYIAYVAKDIFNQRACHILECRQGQAGEVINSIGHAFETRFRQLLNHTPSLLSTNPRSALRLCHKCSPEETITEQKANQEAEVSEHRDYYNVIPGKELPTGGAEAVQITTEEKKQDAADMRVCSSPPVSLYENCSTTDATTAPSADRPCRKQTEMMSMTKSPVSFKDRNREPVAVENCSRNLNWHRTPPSSSIPVRNSVECEVSAEQCAPLSETRIQDLIQGEDWFHGRLGREQAESLLTCSGDFLVRESSSASGQYVLSGMEGATVRHLLLVDPHGQVRTRDQVFLSVGHLVRFHMENQMPIVSGSSELCLKQPVLQQH